MSLIWYWNLRSGILPVSTIGFNKNITFQTQSSHLPATAQRNHVHAMYGTKKLGFMALELLNLRRLYGKLFRFSCLVIVNDTCEPCPVNPEKAWKLNNWREGKTNLSLIFLSCCYKFLHPSFASLHAVLTNSLIPRLLLATQEMMYAAHA